MSGFSTRKSQIASTVIILVSFFAGLAILVNAVQQSRFQGEIHLQRINWWIWLIVLLLTGPALLLIPRLKSRIDFRKNIPGGRRQSHRNHTLSKERALLLDDNESNGVFVSYSHQDMKWVKKLRKFLKPYVRNQSISYWDDSKIKTGKKWKGEIDHALETACVAVLLVSSDFLASDFIANHELRPLLEAAEQDGLIIVWVLISACAFTETDIAHYQSAYDPSRPIDSLSDAEQNQAFLDICDKIKSAVKSRKADQEQEDENSTYDHFRDQLNKSISSGKLRSSQIAPLIADCLSPIPLRKSDSYDFETLENAIRDSDELVVHADSLFGKTEGRELAIQAASKLASAFVHSHARCNALRSLTVNVTEKILSLDEIGLGMSWTDKEQKEYFEVVYWGSPRDVADWLEDKVPIN